MYRSLDLRRRVGIADGYVERRHLNPIHEVVKAPMLLGYPNLLSSGALRLVADGLPDLLDDADIVLVREPWQMPYVLDKRSADTPIVFSSHNVETERFGDIKQPAFSKRVAERVAELERRAVEDSDAIVCTSERDATVYSEEYDPGGPVFVAPNGTYEDRLRSHSPDSSAARRCRSKHGVSAEATVCTFMGSNYRPNVEAARAVLELANQVAHQAPPVHFFILGSVGRALSRDSTPANVTITGYLEDEFEAHLDATDIALNPMQSGGGTNIKLIDYFARSLPVVSTPFGVRGMAAQDGQEVVVAELDRFPDAIAELQTRPEYRRELGDAACELAAQRYTWEAASRDLHERLVAWFDPQV